MARHLPCLRLAERAEPGEPVWALGFPVRTERGPRAYPDADGTLRVSQGLLLGPEPGVGMQGWRADLDGLSGNSGSPVVNARGKVVGLFRNHTHYDHPDTGPVDRRFVEYGGEAQVAPADPLRHFLDSLA